MFLKHELTCLLPVFVSAEEAQGAPSPEGSYWKGRPRCRGALPVAWREDTGLEPRGLLELEKGRKGTGKKKNQQQ